MSENVVVEPGMRITLEITYTDAEETLKFVIVPDTQADFARGFLGEGTPLAQAILGHAAGEELPYRLGDARSVRIVAITPSSDPAPDENVNARREEKMRQAVEQAQRTDAMIFASSFSGKWGDYDPQGIEQWDTGADAGPDAGAKEDEQ
jgi:hypothetical protein